MPKRFRDTYIWNHDWYIELPNKYKLFWQYILDDCDCAGIWKPNLKRFEFVTELKIDLEDFLSVINSGKQRLVPLPNLNILIQGFVQFQSGFRLSPSNNAHKGIIRCLIAHQVSNDLLWGQVEVNEPPKVKESEKEKVRDMIKSMEKLNYKINYLSPKAIKEIKSLKHSKNDQLSRRLFSKPFDDLNEYQRNQVLSEYH